MATVVLRDTSVIIKNLFPLEENKPAFFFQNLVTVLFDTKTKELSASES